MATRTLHKRVSLSLCTRLKHADENSVYTNRSTSRGNAENKNLIMRPRPRQATRIDLRPEPPFSVCHQAFAWTSAGRPSLALQQPRAPVIGATRRCIFGVQRPRRCANGWEGSPLQTRDLFFLGKFTFFPFPGRFTFFPSYFGRFTANRE